MSHRRAASLAELLVILSACTVILTTSVTLIHRAMHSQSASRVFFDCERSALRLSQQFRRDVHEANSATIENGSASSDPMLRLTFADDQTVEYRRAKDNVVRLVTQHSRAVSHDEFTFRSPLAWTLRQEDSPRRLILSLTAGAAGSPSALGDELPPGAFAVPMSLEVEACVGHANQKVPQ
jgi:hypothetical protein